MRGLSIGLSVLLLALPAGAAQATTGKIVKVLPFLVDTNGQQSLSPSLFERDAYQAKLRHEPSQCGGMRFDVQWRAWEGSRATLSLRLELMTTHAGKDRPVVLEQPVRAKNHWRRWTRLWLKGEAFRAAGEVIAWRATLWDSDRLLADQRSFLW